MSHATILVIQNPGDPPLDQLMHPYWELDLKYEDLIKDPRAVFQKEYTIAELQEKMDSVNKEHAENRESKEKFQDYQLKIYDTLEQFAKDYCGTHFDEKTQSYGYYSNPNAKWDWYSLGGRWTGRLKLKKGAKGLIGRSGLMTEPAPPGTADSATVKDIDPECLKTVHTWAVLKEGKWIERAEMGWFGMSGDAHDTYIPPIITEDELINQLSSYDHLSFNYTMETILLEMERLNNYYLSDHNADRQHSWQTKSPVMGEPPLIYQKFPKGGSEEDFRDFYITMQEKGLCYCVRYIMEVLNLINKNYTYDPQAKQFNLKSNMDHSELGKNDVISTIGWNSSYYDRFIKNLAPDSIISIIDYHI